MTAIPKPAARHKDPELLAELHELWQEMGCALCSAMPTGTELGEYVEIHHLTPQRHDYPWATVGLGGAFMCGCHKAVTEKVFEIIRNDQGLLVWRDRRAGGLLWKPVRFVHKYSMIPPGATAESNGAGPNPPPTVEPVARSREADPQAEPPPAAALSPAVAGGVPSPDDPPDVRAQQIRDRVTSAKRLTMEAAILLNHAAAREDHIALGVSWADYTGSVGLERSNVTKMLAAARSLGDEWQRLQPGAREHISLEQLYQGSLLVKSGWDADAAMDAVVSNPTSRLIALRTGDEPAAKCRCTCEHCGRELFHERGPS